LSVCLRRFFSCAASNDDDDEECDDVTHRAVTAPDGVSATTPDGDIDGADDITAILT
jgi:hypothetical protein